MESYVRTAKCGIVDFRDITRISNLLKSGESYFVQIDNTTINVVDRLKKHILIWSNLHHHNKECVHQLDWATLLTVWLTSRLEFPNQYAYITDFNELLLYIRSAK